jgi:hypothetical protein
MKRQLDQAHDSPTVSVEDGEARGESVPIELDDER